MSRPIIDHRLRNSIPSHWPSRCTIQTIDVTAEDTGQNVPDGTGTDVAGLVSIECRMAPRSDYEQRTEDLTSGHIRRKLKLNGYYPTTITPGSMQAVVDGVTFPIRGVSSDSEQFSTELLLEEIEPIG